MVNDTYISVCIPTYNRADTIGRMIRSIIAQTYNKIHIFVCDNASNDNTREVVEGIKDDRIKYIYFDEHLDVNYSFVRSLKCATDEFVCLYHSDDWYYPDIIQNEFDYLTQECNGAVFTLMNKVEDETQMEIQGDFDTDYDVLIYDYKKYINEALCRGTIFCCPTFMTKKSILEEVGILNSKTNMISDMNFWIKIVKSYKCILLNRPFMNYCVSETQLSKQITSSHNTISPQFIILDEIITNSNDETIIDKQSIQKYQKRRNEEIVCIARKDLGRDYQDYILGERILTIENIAGSETEYLRLLYNKG